MSTYRVFCVTENSYYLSSGNLLVPTVCPNNNAHVITPTLTLLMQDPTTVTDFQLSKACHVIKSSDQALSNVSQVVTITNEAIVSRDYFTTAIDGSHIWIRNAGSYLLLYRVGAYNGTAYNGTAYNGTSLFVANTTVTWSLNIDTTLTGTSYTAIPGATIYTTHRATNSGYESSIGGAVVTVPVGGAWVNISGFISFPTSSYTNLFVANDYTSFTFSYNTGCYFADTYSSTLQTITSTYTDMALGTNRLINALGYSHATPSAAISIVVTGYHFVQARITFGKSSNTELCRAGMRLTMTGSSSGVITGSAASSSTLFIGNKVTIGFVGIFLFFAGDTVTLQCGVDIGTSSSVFCSANECGLGLLYIPPILYPLSSVYASQLTSTATTQLTSTWLDVILPTAYMNIGSWSYSAAGVLTIPVNGRITVTSLIQATNGGVSVRQLFSRFIVSVDNGSTWLPILGSSSGKPINISNSKTSLMIDGVLQVFVGTLFKIQVKTDGSNGDLIYLTDTTNFSAIISEPMTTPVINGITYGSYNQTCTSNDSFTSSVSGYQEKMRMATRYNPAGYYKVYAEATFTCASNTGVYNWFLTYTNSTFQTVTLFLKTFDSACQKPTIYFEMSDTNVVFMPAGCAVIIMQINFPTASTSTFVTDGYIEILRIGL